MAANEIFPLAKNSIFCQDLRKRAGCMEQGRDFNEKIVF